MHAKIQTDLLLLISVTKVIMVIGVVLMNGFDFYSTTRIIFGRGRLRELGDVANAMGRHALLVTGGLSLQKSGMADRIRQILNSAGVSSTPFSVKGEPDTTIVEQGLACARAAGCDMVIAVGGGSVLDAAKAIGALSAVEGPMVDYLEIVGRGLPLPGPGLTVVTVPTTSGTGAEVTRNAVIAYHPAKRKVSMRSPYLLPRVALVDPSLTDSMPPDVTAASGFDALTQLAEAYISRNHNPFTDALVLDGIKRAVVALSRVYADPGDTEARDEMSLAALASGLALSSAGLGAVHGIAGPLGGMFPVPHGVACAVLLPHIWEANARALSRQADRAECLKRMACVASILLGEVSSHQDQGASALLETALRGGEFLQGLVRNMGIPALGTFGVTGHDVGLIVQQARGSSSMRSNPVELETEALAAAIRSAIG